jgi:dienelactone hydrolase
MLKAVVATAAAVAMVTASASSTVGLRGAQADEAVPAMGGGYAGGKNVVAIPVDDPDAKAIAGALFKPAGASPFPVVIYMSGCGGLVGAGEIGLQKAVIDHMQSKGVATLIVDPFMPRGEFSICYELSDDTLVKYASRGASDLVAAVKFVRTLRDIDPNRVFLLGNSYGAVSALFAVDTSAPIKRDQDTKIAGVIAYYPGCYDKLDPNVPTLVFVGDKDDWTPAKPCEAIGDKPNLKIVVYPGATHGFAMRFDQPFDFMGHHMEFDEKATKDAEDRVDAFIAAYTK